MSSIDSKKGPRSGDLSYGKRAKSSESKSGEYGWCAMVIVEFLARKRFAICEMARGRGVKFILCGDYLKNFVDVNEDLPQPATKNFIQHYCYRRKSPSSYQYLFFIVNKTNSSLLGLTARLFFAAHLVTEFKQTSAPSRSTLNHVEIRLRSLFRVEEYLCSLFLSCKQELTTSAATVLSQRKL